MAEEALRAQARRVERLALEPEPHPEPEPQAEHAIVAERRVELERPQPELPAERRALAAALCETMSGEDEGKASDLKGKLAEWNERALRDAARDGQTAAVRVLLAAGTDPDAAGDVSPGDVSPRRGERRLSGVRARRDVARRMRIERLRGRPAVGGERGGAEGRGEGWGDGGGARAAGGGDRSGRRTALHLATAAGHEEAVEALVEGGADLDKVDSAGGATPLMIAAWDGSISVVRRLLALGADHTAVGTKYQYEGKTALEVAEDKSREDKGNVEAACVLREWPAFQRRLAFAGGGHARLGANSPLLHLDADALRRAGEACLGEARAQRVEGLRGRPAAENEQALRDAAMFGKTAEVRLLLAAGTDPDAADWYGRSALHYVAMRGRDEAAVALVEGGADVDKAQPGGATPLVWAAYEGHSGVVRRLLDLGADHTAVGTGYAVPPFVAFEGKTALEVAEEVPAQRRRGPAGGPRRRGPGQRGESDEDFAIRKKGKEEAAAVLREWAASHP